MDQQKFTGGLLAFLENSPTPFHAVDRLTRLLADGGFTRLDELQGDPGPGRYFTCRNGSSLIAFCSDGQPLARLRLAGAHTDSPGFKIKPRPIRIKHGQVQLGIEPYGSGLLGTWFDRDLSIAGRICWMDDQNGPHTSLIDFRRPVAVIPSLAIHLNKEANEGKPVNRQSDLAPLLMQTGDDEADFAAILKKRLVEEHRLTCQPDILDHDLFVYDCQPPARLGLQDDFIAGGRLDNLLSCYTLIQALVQNHACNALVVLNDHEEVGSLSTTGAQGTFLQSVLDLLLPENRQRHHCLGRSLFVSADNAHAVHPNFADRHDQGHLPRMNGGPVIKYNANQRYATSSATASFYRLIAQRVNVPVQEFVMRSDLACGSTIGPLVAGGTGVPTIDLGVPTLAMHSVRELAGNLDAWSLFKVMQAFFALEPDDAAWRCLS